MTTKTLFASRPRNTRRRSLHLVCCAWLAAISSAPAETIRVASWSLAPSLNFTNSGDVTRVAETLTRLDPDVILLQRVRDSNVCLRVAAALKPAEYNLLVCSSFGDRPNRQFNSQQIAELPAKKHALEMQIASAKLDLQTAQQDWLTNQDALGNLAHELASTEPTTWPEVSPEKAEEYRALAQQLETVGDQERELRRRGYKEAHPLIQSVRAQLRNFSARRAEMDRDFPALKYILIGTNAPDWSIGSRISDHQRLRLRTNSLRKIVTDLETGLADLLQVEAAFKDNSLAGEPLAQASQIAILAKKSAYFASADAWTERKEQGFVFSAIQHGQRRIGFFCVKFPNQPQPTGAVHQLLGKINSIRRWEQYPVETFVIACSFEANSHAGQQTATSQVLSSLARAGFSDALRDPALNDISGRPDDPRSKPHSSDYILAESTSLPLNPQAINQTETGRPLLLCDLELDPVRVSAGRLSRVEAQTGNARIGLPGQPLPAWWALALIGFLFVLGIIWLLAKSQSGHSRRTPRLLPVEARKAGSPPAGYTVIVTPLSITGSAPDSLPALPPPWPIVHLETPSARQTQSVSWEQRALAAEAQAKHAQAIIQKGLLPDLGRWLKHKFLHKLLVDRSQLLAAQEEATRKVMAVDARLTRLELQIQQQTQSYVRRIEELSAELAAAKEENRELIRSKIAQVKLELEAARKKLLEQQSKSART